MKIALTVDPELPVPPIAYGGIERIVDILAKGLVDRGHEVVLFAHAESTTAGTLVPWPGSSSTSKLDILKNASTLARHVYGGGFDIVHSHSRLAYLVPLAMSPVPKLMTYHRPIDPKAIQKGRQILGEGLEFTALSKWMIQNVAQLAPWHIVPNGVPINTYSYNPAVAPDAPFVFLGRVEEIKGPHLAIEIAKKAGRSVVLAGNIPPEHTEWFEANIRPHLNDHSVRYVGPVNDQQKNELLRHASALLMPILWEEPFGLVVAEAMACGTPVLGFPRGALPEIVVEGVTGYLRHDVDSLVSAASHISRLKREDSRRHVEAHYSGDVLVERYLAAYVAHNSTLCEA